MDSSYSSATQSLMDIAAEVLRLVQNDKQSKRHICHLLMPLLAEDPSPKNGWPLEGSICLLCEGPLIRNPNKDLVFSLPETPKNSSHCMHGRDDLEERAADDTSTAYIFTPGQCYSLFERRKALSEDVLLACDACIIKLAQTEFEHPTTSTNCEHSPCKDCHNQVTPKPQRNEEDSNSEEMADSNKYGYTQLIDPDIEVVEPVAVATSRSIPQISTVTEMQLKSNVSLKIFKLEQIEALKKDFKINSSDAEAHNRVNATIKRMLEAGMYRRLIAPNDSWQHDLEQLQRQFPNFSKTIEEAILPSLAIASVGGIARPTPLLLVGPPGIGKSYFSEMLGAMLGVPMANIDMASASMGSSIGGLAAHWANSGPGEVFKMLALGRSGREPVANPLFFLDEVDKVSPEHRYDPLAPLHTLLETESARKFADESIPSLQMDASHIRWILCANDSRSIPKPILSRVHVVNVPEPTRSERREMFVRIFANVVKDSGLDEFDTRISPAVIDIADTMGPREFKTKSVMALGNALLNSRMHVGDSDFVASAASSRPRMGFR